MQAYRRIGAAVTLIAACALACAANDFPGLPAPIGPAASDSTNTSWEVACEVALNRLDQLLAARDSNPAGSAADIAEARELRREALDLMAAADYELAFDLFSTAISVLEAAP